MESLKDRINRKREEVSDKTYDSQREFADSDAVEDLREEVKVLTNRVDDVNHRTNYHESELIELNAAMDILIEAVSMLQEAVIKTATEYRDELKSSINNVAERLMHDEELIGIDDESDHCLGQDLTLMDMVETDEIRSEIGLTKLQFNKKVDTMVERYDRQVVEIAKAFNKTIEGLQEQINRKLPSCE